MSPREAMFLAIEEGKKGAGFVSPNPLVGCVILDRDFNLIGKGYHARVGEGHAEVEAMRSLKDQRALEGAHFYVTLEPCAHEGRTPSCAKTLAKLPIAGVTYGLKDPNPLVSGQGAEILRAAGKSVTLFTELQDELEELCEIFLLNMREKRSFVALKAGVSLDGKMAFADGTSKWITGEESREFVQYLRGCYDAVLAGVGTLLADDPRLNSRHPLFAARRQRVVVLDPQGRSFSKLAGMNLLKVRAPEDVFVVTETEEKPPIGVQVLRIPRVSREFQLNQVLERLKDNGIHSLFVEGGAFAYSAFMNQKMADRLYLFIAPKVIGEGLNWTSGVKRTLPPLRGINVRKFGEDVLWSGRFTWPAD